MRIHFAKIGAVEFAYLPDSMRYFEINEFTKSVLEDIAEDVNQDDVCKKHDIIKNNYLDLKNVVSEENKVVVMNSAPNFKTLNRLVLHISNSCNLACRYCYANGGSYSSNEGGMSAEILNKCLSVFFERFEKINGIQLFGGEPLLFPENIRAVCEFVQMLPEDKRPRLGVVTNGTLHDDETLELIREYNVNVTVSLDGPACVNDKLRVRETDEGTTACVERSIRKLMSEKDIPVMIEATYTNVHEEQRMVIGDVVSYFHEAFDVKNIHLAPVTSDKYALQNPNAFADSVRELFKISREGRPLPTYVTKVISRLRNKRCSPFLCDAGAGTLAVASDGNVYPCFMFVDQEDFCYGHIDDENLFQEIFHGRVSEKILDFDKFADPKNCGDCFANTTCSGCLGKNYFETGNIHTPSSDTCDMERSILENVIAELILSNPKTD